MTSKAQIDSFLKSDKLAIAGVSRDEKKFGFLIYKKLKEIIPQIYPINPNADLIDGSKVFKSFDELPEGIENLFIVTKKDKTKDVISEAVKYGIKNIWIQQMSETNEALELANQNSLNIIYKKCIFMYADPVNGIHKFHRFMAKLFGKY